MATSSRYFIYLYLLLLFSCKGVAPPPEAVPSVKSHEITLEFCYSDLKSGHSKSFFDNQVELWEEELNSITCYIFRDGMNHIVAIHKFSPSEIATMKATFVLPNFTPDFVYHCYVIANAEIDINNMDDLNSLLLDDIWSYNGTFSEISKGSLREGGFVLSGFSNITSPTEDRHIDLTVSISRIVSKYAIKVSIAEEFDLQYPGLFSIDSVILTNTSDYSPLLEPTSFWPSYNGFSPSQVPNIEGIDRHCLFYIFENGKRNEGEEVTLNIYATYDLDHNLITTTDRQSLVYKIAITQNGGSLLRNTYYKHTVTIIGLKTDEFLASFAVVPWNARENVEIL